MADMLSLYGPLRRTYQNRLPELVRGNEHSAIIRGMKPRSEYASLAPTSWTRVEELSSSAWTGSRGGFSN